MGIISDVEKNTGQIAALRRLDDAFVALINIDTAGNPLSAEKKYGDYFEAEARAGRCGINVDIYNLRAENKMRSFGL